jgi:hypothetical protein
MSSPPILRYHFLIPNFLNHFAPGAEENVGAGVSSGNEKRLNSGLELG